MSRAEELAAKLNKPPRAAKNTASCLVCRVRDVRKSIGLSLQEVAADVGISASALSAIEAGGGCRLAAALEIADFFGMAIDELWLRK